MKLNVLNVAYPFAPVGPDAVGGAEQILTHIDAALVRAGHRSIVIACEGSSPAGTLISIPRVEGEIADTKRALAHERHRAAIEHALCRWPVDLVHLHGIDFHDYFPPPGVPVLATLHLPPSWYPPEVFQSERPETYLHCVSRAQRRACPPHAALLPEIENGVPLDLLRPARRKRSFAIALGRICPEKGFHIAIDAAKRAGVPLLLAGDVFPYQSHQRYFRREIVPRLDELRRFIGPIGVRRKRRLLAAARCLLIPSLVSETSSLVAMESFACGTPVIAFPAGALAEIVEHERTGLLVRDEQEMAAAIPLAETVDSNVCRATAESRFSAERMCRRYLDFYQRIGAGWKVDLETPEIGEMQASSV